MKKFILSFFLTFISIIGKAAWSDEYNYSYYGIPQGLCDEYVVSTFIDSDGYLWACTSNGLDRFDGHTFVHFSSTSDNPATKIKSNFINGITEDHLKNLWLISSDGLMKLDKKEKRIIYPEEMGRFSGIVSQPMMGILSLEKESFWLLMDRSFAHVRLSQEGEIKDINVFPTKLDRNRVMSITRDMIYIGSLKGIEIYSISSNEELIPYDDPSIDALTDIKDVSYILSSGSYLWIGTEDGLFQYNSKEKILTPFRHSETNDQSISDNHITCLAYDESGDLLIGTTRGIDKLSRTGHFSHMVQDRPGRSINTNYVNNIRVAEDGSMWVSTLVGGINKISPKTVSFHDILSVSQGTSNIVSCSMEDKDGNLMVGILGKGLGIKKAGQSEVKIFSLKEMAGVSQNDIFAIQQDNDGNYWICSRFDGLIFMDRKDLDHPSFKTYNTANRDIPDDHIYDIAYDKTRNGLWACTTSGFFFMETSIRKAMPVKMLYNPDGIQRFFCLHLDTQGRLWAGGYGLIVCDLGKGTEVKNTYTVDFHSRLNNDSSDSRERISSITQTPSGRIFISSNSNGIYEALSDGTFQKSFRINSQLKDEMATPSVSKVLSDMSDNLWIGSSKGIFHYNLESGLITQFFVSDGLPSSNCYINSGCNMSHGKVAFGTNNGLVIIDTPYNPVEQGIKKPFLTAVRNSGRLNLWNTGEVLHIYPSDPDFELYLSSMDLTQSDRTWYAYTLKNDGSPWVVTKSSTLSFFDLKPGRYDFKAICTYPDNHWSDDVMSMMIIVHPRLTQRPLFWILIALIILGLAGVLITDNFIRKARTQKELKQQVEEKTADLTKAMNDIMESKNSIEKQNVILEEQKLKLEEYSASMEKANNERLMLYTNLTHEFKTPLSLIMGPVSELSETCKDESIKTSLGIISRNSKYLLSLVNQILDLRKVDSGKITVKKEALSIPSLLSVFTMDFNKSLQSRNINIETNLRLIGNMISSDFDILFKILSNLLSNASKYTPDGGKITLNLAQFRRGNDGRIMQYMSVSNTGSYIKEDDLDKIFDCFYKADGSPIYERSQGSTGIGLYLVRNLIGALGGQISVKSNRISGTSFRLYFPTELVKDENKEAFIEQGEPVDDMPTLLLVEDNDDMRAFIKGILSGRFNVKEAPNGEKGYELAKQTIPDFIISDLMMPVCDGLKFCKMVREDSLLSHIPFMMLTALGDDDTRLNSYRQGVSAFLVKPFSKDMLLARIDNILNDKRKQQEELSFDLENSYATVNIDRSDKAFMEQLMTVLKENYTDPEFSIPKLQTLMCMSMTPFYKKVSSLTGLTPAMLIRRYRLQTAKTLMENNTDKRINVSEIAYMVGFNDPKYFSKCFSKEYHIKPSELLQDKIESDE